MDSIVKVFFRKIEDLLKCYWWNSSIDLCEIIVVIKAREYECTKMNL